MQKKASTSRSEQKEDILVSIVLTESTSSLLNLNLPKAEHLDNKSIEQALETAQSNSHDSAEEYETVLSNHFTNYWFGEDRVNTKKTDGKEVSREVAYFADNPSIDESVSSFDFDDGARKKPNSTTVLIERLKPTSVYARPLVAVKSLPESNMLKIKSSNNMNSGQGSNKEKLDSEWSNVCRICHGGESNGNLVSPCDCRGSIAMAHIECLERWLKESSNSECELCKHQYVVIREPRYSIPKSIYLFLRHPGDHLSELLFDLFAFVIYTPAAVVSTYMLILLCETVAKNQLHYSRNLSSHIITLSAVLAIDFTYSSWLMVNLQKHFIAWKHWYRNNSKIKVILPKEKQTNVVDSAEQDID